MKRAPSLPLLATLIALLAAGPHPAAGRDQHESVPPRPAKPARAPLGESKLEHATAHAIAFAFNRAEGLTGEAALGREARVKGRTPEQVMDPRNWRPHLPKGWQPYGPNDPGSWNHVVGAVTAALLAGDQPEKCAQWLARHYELETDGTYGLQGLEPNGYSGLHGLYRSANLWWALRHGDERLARAAGRALGDSLLIYAALVDDLGHVHLPGARGGKGAMPIQGPASDQLAAARGRAWRRAEGFGPRWTEWEEAYGGRILRATLERWPEKAWGMMQLDPQDLQEPLGRQAPARPPALADAAAARRALHGRLLPGAGRLRQPGAGGALRPRERRHRAAAPPRGVLDQRRDAQRAVGERPQGLGPAAHRIARQSEPGVDLDDGHLLRRGSGGDRSGKRLGNATNRVGGRHPGGAV